MIDWTFLDDDRGVSTAVSYILAIGITVILVSGLVVGMNSMMGSQSDRALDSELRVIGEGLGSEITSVDRVAMNANEGDTHIMRIEAPMFVAGEPYRIELDPNEGESHARLVLITSERQHTVFLNTRSEIAHSSVQGGTLWIATDGSELRLTEERP